MAQDQYPYFRSGAEMQFCLAPGVLTKKAGQALDTEFWGYRLEIDPKSVHVPGFEIGVDVASHRACVHNTTDFYKFGGDSGIGVLHVAKHESVMNASIDLKCCSNGTAGDPTGTTIQFSSHIP